MTDLAAREANLQKELSGLEQNRAELAAVVDESARMRYERLFRQKGQNVVVGIDHGVCGGCHMQLSRQTVVHCQAEQELILCPIAGAFFITPATWMWPRWSEGGEFKVQS